MCVCVWEPLTAMYLSTAPICIAILLQNHPRLMVGSSVYTTHVYDTHTHTLSQPSHLNWSAVVEMFRSWVVATFPHQNLSIYCLQAHFFQGPVVGFSNRGSRSGLARPFLILFFPSWVFPDFFRCSPIFHGIPRLVIFRLSRTIKILASARIFPKVSATESGPFPEKRWQTPRFGNPPVYLLSFFSLTFFYLVKVLWVCPGAV